MIKSKAKEIGGSLLLMFGILGCFCFGLLIAFIGMDFVVDFVVWVFNSVGIFGTGIIGLLASAAICYGGNHLMET